MLVWPTSVLSMEIACSVTLPAIAVFTQNTVNIVMIKIIIQLLIIILSEWWSLRLKSLQDLTVQLFSCIKARIKLSNFCEAAHIVCRKFDKVVHGNKPNFFFTNANRLCYDWRYITFTRILLTLLLSCISKNILY